LVLEIREERDLRVLDEVEINPRLRLLDLGDDEVFKEDGAHRDEEIAVAAAIVDDGE
jgi:hypothetical protein